MKKLSKLLIICIIAALCALAFAACVGGGKKEFTVAVENGTGGGAFKGGTQVTVTATIPGGKEFVAWLEGETQVSTQNPYTFTITKNITLTATFKDAPGGVTDPVQCTVTVVGGTVQGGGTSGTFDKDTQITVTATIPSGKEFVAWLEGETQKSTQNPYTFTLTKDITLTATFKDASGGNTDPVQYTVTVVNGTVQGGGANGTFNKDAQVTVAATVPDDKEFAAWFEGETQKSTQNPYTFTLTANITLTATFVHAHSWEWLVTMPPTEAADGVETKTCTRCEETDGTRPAYATGTAGLAFALINSNTAYSVSRGTASGAHIVIPSRFNRLSVTEITGRGFYNFSNMTDITIPNSVTSIGNSAFYSCTALVSITIPDSVRTVGADAFRYCSNVITSLSITWHYNPAINPSNFDNYLTSVIIGNNITNIRDYAFRDCRSLINVTIPDSVRSIGVGAFFECIRLTSITIPDSVTSIGDSAFYRCTSLTSITIPDSVTSISDNVFSHCAGLTGIIVSSENKVYKSDGNCIIRIQDNVLVVGIKTSIIPNYVTSIGNYAFNGCTGLTSITIPDGVRSIGVSAFLNCTGLFSIIIPDSVTSIGETAFYNCSNLATIRIPNGVMSIERRTFDSCASLILRITIPDSVTSIGEGAFAHCTYLRSITISDNVTSIGSSVFTNCSNLTIYTAMQEQTRPSGWHSSWNYPNRPVIWGVTLSPDKTYAVSFTKAADSISNPAAQNGISAPYRAGYTFGGWATTEGGTTAAYTAANVNSAPNGTTLYAIWIENLV